MVALRRAPDGSILPMVTFVCPVCGFGVAGSEVEMSPPVPGQVPYCPECFNKIRWVRMERKLYLSGPCDLRIG